MPASIRARRERLLMTVAEDAQKAGNIEERNWALSQLDPVSRRPVEHRKRAPKAKLTPQSQMSDLSKLGGSK